MSELKDRLIKEFENSYDKSYQIFNKFVEGKIIENHGVYVMDKIDYYQYCNKAKEDNSAKRYLKGAIDYYQYCNEEKENNSAKQYLERAKRFIRTIINLPSEFPICIDSSKIYKRIEHERIDYTGEPTPSICLKYCIKRFCKEHEDCIVYLRDYKELYFQMIID